MTNVRKTLATTVAVLLCATFTACGRQSAPAFTADTLSSQTLPVCSREPEPAPDADSLPTLQAAIRQLNTIARDLSDTKENTNPWLTLESWRTIAGISLILALFGLIVTAVNTYEQWRTQHNTSRLPLKEQQGILIDMVRHLYRNLVVSRTIETKMRALDFRAYPSEEHLVKLQIPLERIKLDSFLNTNFTALSNLYLLLRNYNEEVLIIKEHFKDPDLNREAKERDIETLTFKCGFLASRICSFLTDDPKQQRKWNWKIGRTLIEIIKTEQPRNDGSRHAVRLDMIERIKQAQSKNVAENSGNAIASEIEQAIEPYKNEKDHFMKIFDSEELKTAFWEGLNRDIRIECGNKQKAEEMTKPDFEYEYTTDKVYMIKFGSGEKPSDSQENKPAAEKPTDEKSE